MKKIFIKKNKIILLYILIFVLIYNISSLANFIYQNQLDNVISSIRFPVPHPEAKDYFGYNCDVADIRNIQIKEDDDKRKNKISLTFDSAYINKFTYQILDILDIYNVKATFFMTLPFMKNNNEQVKEILKRGHEIGNHTVNHPHMKELTYEKAYNEIMEWDKYYKELTGEEANLFRFPYGEYSEENVALVKKCGYYPIHWSFDTIDWRNDGLEFLINRLNVNQSMITEGSIILMHNGAEFTPQFLPYLFEVLKEKNLSVVPVSELIYSHNFILKSGTQISTD